MGAPIVGAAVPVKNVKGFLPKEISSIEDARRTFHIILVLCETVYTKEYTKRVAEMGLNMGDVLNGAMDSFFCMAFGIDD